jgi:hypothetical protein
MAWIAILAFTFCNAGAASAQSWQKPDDSYQWSAELVTFDEAARTVTLRAMAFGDAPKQAATLKSGDKIFVRWSGFDKYANAINGLQKVEGGKADPRFAFPAEFVGFAPETNYVTFKVTIPADSVNRMKATKPGQWITATCRHGADAIVAIRGYNDLETATAK